MIATTSKPDSASHLRLCQKVQGVWIIAVIAIRKGLKPSLRHQFKTQESDWRRPAVMVEIMTLLFVAHMVGETEQLANFVEDLKNCLRHQ